MRMSHTSFIRRNLIELYLKRKFVFQLYLGRAGWLETAPFCRVFDWKFFISTQPPRQTPLVDPSLVIRSREAIFASSESPRLLCETVFGGNVALAARRARILAKRTSSANSNCCSIGAPAWIIAAPTAAGAPSFLCGGRRNLPCCSLMIIVYNRERCDQGCIDGPSIGPDNSKLP